MASAAPNSQTPPSGQSAAPANAPQRPEWVGEPYWDAEKATIKPEFGQHYRDLTAFKAAEDSRKLTLPTKPEEYRLELPKDFKPPQGVEFKFDEKDPLLPQAREFALKNGWTQDQFSGAMGLHAAAKIAEKQNIEQAKTAEVQKLGVNGPARKTLVDTWLKAQLGDELGGHFSQFMLTANQVIGVEELMKKFRTQGAGGYSHTNREVDVKPQPTTLAERMYPNLPSTTARAN